MDSIAIQLNLISIWVYVYGGLNLELTIGKDINMYLVIVFYHGQATKDMEFNTLYECKTYVRSLPACCEWKILSPHDSVLIHRKEIEPGRYKTMGS